MAKRKFRSDESLKAEAAARNAIKPFLLSHGFVVEEDARTVRGTAVTQVVTARRDNGDTVKMHVRLCWRRDGRNKREQLYSAAQLRARLIEGDWDKTLDFIADRERADGNTHNLIVQYDSGNFRYAALIPSNQLPAIWRKQREVSAALIASGQTGRWKKNHAMNGQSPTIWLQDDRMPVTRTVADVLWSWPNVVDILTLSAVNKSSVDDSYDDLPVSYQELGRDEAAVTRAMLVRSGYPRDPKVRSAVLNRAAGRCERKGCEEKRDFPGFLDVHHILGVGSSDRVWSCVALCPNCHRDAHFAPNRDDINAALKAFAKKFR